MVSPRRKRLYLFDSFIFTLAVANVMLLMYLGQVVTWEPSLKVFFFVALAVLAEFRPIILQSGDHFTATSVIVLACLWAEGPAPTAFVGAVTLLLDGIIHDRDLIKITFNVLQIGLSVQVAALAFWATGGVFGFGNEWPAFSAIISTIVYFVTNSLCVSAVISITENKPLLDNWREDVGKAFTYHTVTGIVAFVLAAVWVTQGK